MYSVYWIRKIEHTNPLCEGYIGITNNLHRRLQEHKRTQKSIVYNALNSIDNIQIDVLHTVDTALDALEYEKMYRPSERIGWNICAGGGMPPSAEGRVSNMKGKKFSEEHKLKLRKPKAKRTQIHIKKLSEALKGRTGAVTSMYGKQHKRITCPHCLKEGGVNGMKQWHFDKCKSIGG